MSGYMTFWSKEHIRDMKKAGDIGPLLQSSSNR